MQSKLRHPTPTPGFTGRGSTVVGMEVLMGAKKILLSDCFVCEVRLYMGPLPTPTHIFYAGPGKGAEARKAAEKAGRELQAKFPLALLVTDLHSYMEEKSLDDREEGRQDLDF